jgi:nitrogen regulatory protein P-II 2
MVMKIRMKKVTIIGERVLKDPLIELLRQHGARGFTLTAVEGEGSRGVRASEWEGRNVCIDTIVTPAVAESLMEAVGDRYFDDFAVIVYASDVDVLRGDKYE